MQNPSTCRNPVPSGSKLSQQRLDRLQKGDLSALFPSESHVKPSPKVLTIDPLKCNGCRHCESACSLFHTGEVSPKLSRIRIQELDAQDAYLPVACQQCASAPCQAACPKEAISWRDDWGMVAIDYDRCVSCQMCVAACPYGAVGFDPLQRLILKCDLCGGSPQCVSFCEPGALVFQDAHGLQSPRLRQAACRLRSF